MDRGVVDTNVLIQLTKLDPDELPETSLISAITLAELSVGPLVAADDLERARRQAHVQQAEADFDPIPFGREAARAFGRVAAGLRAQGRKPAARAYDALIAATALAEDLPLYTCNPSDYLGIDGLDVRVVSLPARGAATRRDLGDG
ncbi:MAG TPA: type II toxin-antitoxin system VapC family toxin [Arachnia sp.]|nr:type II toxin-antitoxin system VapC family toxin [Arachnia sp.]HMT86029.1 type II toxin-antitoxin system VapC family toxin [Arachnia sp.]